MEFIQQKFKIHVQFFFFCLAIGLHAFFKLSSLLTVAYFTNYTCLCNKFHENKSYDPLKLLWGWFYSLYLTFCKAGSTNNLPELVLLHFIRNRITMHNMNFGEVFYRKHAGRHFVNLFTSTGYATPVQSLAHGFRDLFFNLKLLFHITFFWNKSPNTGCCILTIPFTLILFTALWKSRILQQKEAIVYCFVYRTLSRICFVSFHHGYNYLIYHAYTKEFAIVFFIFGLCYLTMQRNVKIIYCNILMFFCLCQSSPGKSFSQSYIIRFHAYFRIRKEQDFGPSKFSKSLQLISSAQLVSRYLLVSLCRRSSWPFFMTPLDLYLCILQKFNSFPNLKFI